MSADRVAGCLAVTVSSAIRAARSLGKPKAPVEMHGKAIEASPASPASSRLRA